MGAQATRESTAGPGSARPLRAVLLDALGTLVTLEPPAPHLRAELRRRAGIDVSADAAERAFRTEIAFYLEHHLEGRDKPSLERLRDRCAQVIAGELGRAAPDLDTIRAAMLASLRFHARAEAAPALESLREGGLRLVVVSNWDCSLARMLARTGIAPLVDGVIASATVGAAKPDPSVLTAALAAAGAGPGEALHVGDSLAHDVAGARAAGVEAVLLDRDGAARDAGVATIGSLEQLPSLVFRDR
jgi:putative hydrolase of the HAD superfamily